MTDHDYMQYALDQARQALDQGLIPVGAILVVDGEIVAQSHRKQDTSYHLDHAEMLTFRDFFAGVFLKRGEQDITLYTTLEPCMMCLGAIMHLPITKLVYAANDPYGGGVCVMESDSLPFRHKKNNLEIVSGVCEQESKELLKQFFKISELDFYRDSSNPLVSYVLQ